MKVYVYGVYINLDKPWYARYPARFMDNLVIKQGLKMLYSELDTNMMFKIVCTGRLKVQPIFLKFLYTVTVKD